VDQERRCLHLRSQSGDKRLEFCHARVQHSAVLLCSFGIKHAAPSLESVPCYQHPLKNKQRQTKEVQFDLPLYLRPYHHQRAHLGTPVTVISFLYSFVVIAGTVRAHFTDPGFFVLVLQGRYPGICKLQASRETLPKTCSGAKPGLHRK
jgi:hypothetical protein